ncbi:unnamed protein product [Ranitomeya imitator]|uniref:Uncharacterized protein n=1 Tax=Ranitomeya imitator TaxID=111125 RepID=A0ABN9MIK6_9NEOB|nr:unnamed protein product [Ranitomeya imitator]
MRGRNSALSSPGHRLGSGCVEKLQPLPTLCTIFTTCVGMSGRRIATAPYRLEQCTTTPEFAKSFSRSFAVKRRVLASYLEEVMACFFGTRFTLKCKLMGNCCGPAAAETLWIRSKIRIVCTYPYMQPVYQNMIGISSGDRVMKIKPRCLDGQDFLLMNLVLLENPTFLQKRRVLYYNPQIAKSFHWKENNALTSETPSLAQNGKTQSVVEEKLHTPDAPRWQKKDEISISRA